MVRGEHLNEGLLVWDQTGKEYHGHHAYYNDPTGFYSLDIRLFNGERYLSIQTSLPKVAGAGDNFHPVDIETTKSILAWIETDIRERAGIRFDIFNGTTLKRIDLFKNIIPDYGLPVYREALSHMNIARGKLKDYGVSGYLMGNTQWQICLYDKWTEMKKRGVETTGYDRRTIRVESRLLDDRKIIATLGISALSDAIDNPDVLRSYYVESLRRTMFHTPPSGDTLLPSAIDEIIALAMETGGQNFIQKFYQYYALLTLPSSGTDLTLLESKLSDAASQLPGRNRSVTRFMEEMRAIDQIRLMQQPAKGKAKGKSVGDLYSELESKLLDT
jgi:hypothetical protein